MKPSLFLAALTAASSAAAMPVDSPNAVDKRNANVDEIAAGLYLDWEGNGKKAKREANVDEIAAGLYLDWEGNGKKAKREANVDEIAAGLYLDWEGNGKK